MILRYVIAFLSVLAGISAAAAEAKFTFPADLKQGSPEESILLFGLCITFYGMAYASGRTLYALIGARSESDIVARISGTHMLVLHSVGLATIGLFFISGAASRTALAPILLLCVVLMAISIRDFVQSRYT
jgi:hypothetical protein